MINDYDTVDGVDRQQFSLLLIIIYFSFWLYPAKVTAHWLIGWKIISFRNVQECSNLVNNLDKQFILSGTEIYRLLLYGMYIL